MHWLRSFTPVTWYGHVTGVNELTACLQLELFRGIFICEGPTVMSALFFGCYS